MALAAMGLASGLCHAVPHNANQINFCSVKLSQLTIKEGPVKSNVSVNAKPVHASIFVAKGESEDEVMRRFRKAVWESGIVAELKRRRYFESPQDVKKRKNQILRNKKKKRYAKFKSYRNEENTNDNENVEKDDGYDHWGGPVDGGLPF